MTRIEVRSGSPVLLSHGLKGLFQLDSDASGTWCVRQEPGGEAPKSPHPPPAPALEPLWRKRLL